MWSHELGPRVSSLRQPTRAQTEKHRMIHILAAGVFFSGFTKDLLCLPRPLSPPLHRITMSGSAALEYGFPSTHSTNAVSVTVYILFQLRSPSVVLSQNYRTALTVLACLYATSIIVGRLYCGMHGFMDVLVGSILGAVLSVLECLFVNDFDAFIQKGSVRSLVIVILVILLLVRIHPEPADDCPCFDDSVAFAGVLCGAEIGNWHFAQTSYSWNEPVRATVPFHIDSLGWPKTAFRICVGVLCIFAWRGIMKTALLKGLPPVFRVVERLGLSLPRRFFKPATLVIWDLFQHGHLTDRLPGNTIKSPVTSKPIMSCLLSPISQISYHPFAIHDEIDQSRLDRNLRQMHTKLCSYDKDDERRVCLVYP